MYNNFFANELNYEIYINAKFSTAFHLSYTLIDLQSIINGFTYFTKTEGLYSHKGLENLDEIEEIPLSYVDTPRRQGIPFPYSDDSLVAEYPVVYDYASKSKKYMKEDLSDIISNVLDNNSSDIDESARMSLAKSLEASVNLYISDTFSPSIPKKNREPYIQTTTRTFAKKYSHLLKLKSFKSGSLFLDIASSVISGLIVEFIKKIVDADSGKSGIFQVNYTCNNIQVHINDPYLKNNLVNKHISVNETTLTKSYDLNLERYFNELFSHISIEPFDYEGNVIRFIDTLVKNEIITDNCLYNEKGIKTMSKDIKRLSGFLLDTYI
jgi:hypothetical protein